MNSRVAPGHNTAIQENCSKSTCCAVNLLDIPGTRTATGDLKSPVLFVLLDDWQVTSYLHPCKLVDGSWFMAEKMVKTFLWLYGLLGLLWVSQSFNNCWKMPCSMSTVKSMQSWCSGYTPKNAMDPPPQKKKVLCRCFCFSKRVCSGSMLVVRGVLPILIVAVACTHKAPPFFLS